MHKDCSSLSRFRFYMHLICTLYAPYMHLICTLYAPYMHLICTLYAPYMHLICTLYAPYMHLICTLYLLISTHVYSYLLLLTIINSCLLSTPVYPCLPCILVLPNQINFWLSAKHLLLYI